MDFRESGAIFAEVGAMLRIEQSPAADEDGSLATDPGGEIRGGPLGMGLTNAGSGLDYDGSVFSIAGMFGEGNVPVDFFRVCKMAVGGFAAAPIFHFDFYDVAYDGDGHTLVRLDLGDFLRGPLSERFGGVGIRQGLEGFPGDFVIALR